MSSSPADPALAEEARKIEAKISIGINKRNKFQTAIVFTSWKMYTELFRHKVAKPECDQAPCGTGMAYLAPTYAKTASIIARAEGGEAPEGNDIGTNKVFGTMRRMDEAKKAASKKAAFH